MIPGKEILRNPNSKVPVRHKVIFPKETIEKCRNRFHAEKLENKVNINHNKKVVEGVILRKSFIIGDLNRKNMPLEFINLPNGTWMIEYEITNQWLWKLIVEKRLNGFSIEGRFDYTLRIT